MTGGQDRPHVPRAKPTAFLDGMGGLSRLEVDATAERPCRAVGRHQQEGEDHGRRRSDLEQVSVATSDSPSVATKFPTDGHDVAGG